MFSTILIPLDGSPLAERALPYAERLARAGPTRLVLTRAVLARAFPGTDPAQAQVRAVEAAESYLASVVGRLAERGVAAETAVPYGPAAEAIQDETRIRRADLVVMSTHGRTGLGRWIYGSVADRVLRRAEVPVLLVPAACEHPWPGDRTLRVLVPLDGSNLAEEALGPAGRLAERLGAELLLLRAVEPPVAPLGDETYRTFRPDEELAAAEQYLEGIAGRLRTEGRTVASRAVVGYAPWEIPRAARDEGADAIAMATHGRGGLARLVLGSVATLTLQRTPVPLLLARPAAVTGAMAGPTAAEPEPVGPPVSVTLDAREQQLVRESLEFLLSTSERQERLAEPLHELLSKLSQARSEATGGTDAAPG